MANHRKPASLHRLTGTLRADRHAARERQHGEAGIGAPPKHLGEPLRALWRELADAVPKGVAAASDRHAFELLTRLVGLSREGKASSAHASQLRLLLHSFGMTPLGRQQLGVESEAASLLTKGPHEGEGALAKYLR